MAFQFNFTETIRPPRPRAPYHSPGLVRDPNTSPNVLVLLAVLGGILLCWQGTR